MGSIVFDRLSEVSDIENEDNENISEVVQAKRKSANISQSKNKEPR